MKKLWLILILIFGVFIIGCQNQENIGSQHEAIIQGNEKVIIAPTWEPKIFKDHVDSVNKVSGPTGQGFTVYE